MVIRLGPVAFVPAEKNRLSEEVVDIWNVPPDPPRGSVFQKDVPPQIPVAESTDPGLVPLVSQ